jgi:hypothetical protein
MMDKWLSRIVLGSLAILLCVMCVFVWRLSVLIASIDHSIVAVAADVKSVTETAAGLSQRIDRLASHLDALDKAKDELAQSAEIQAIVDEAGAKLDAINANPPNPEIQALLNRIGNAQLTYEYEGKQRAAAWVQAKLRAKYLLFQKDVNSAEDFIEQVAAHTSSGAPYYVIADTKKLPLRDFLLETLNQQRKEATPPTP